MLNYVYLKLKALKLQLKQYYINQIFNTIKPANNSEPRRPVVERILLTQQIVDGRLVIDVRHRRRPRHAKLPRVADVCEVELGRRPGHFAVRRQPRRYGVHGDGLADHVAAVKGGAVVSATRQFGVSETRNGDLVPIKFSIVFMKKMAII